MVSLLPLAAMTFLLATASGMAGPAAPDGVVPGSAPSAQAPAPPGSGTSLAALLASDMSMPSEALPHGLTYDFAFAPRLSAGADPGSFTSLTAWGQLFECATGNPQPAAHVEIRDIESWVMSRSTGAWTRAQQSTAPVGAAFAENFAGNVSRPANAAATADGGTSASAGGGFNYHFWPRGDRASIDPSDVGGVAATVRARLAPGTYDPVAAPPCFVLSMGADYWATPDATQGGSTLNKDVGIGRFKRVDGDWRVFTMSTTSSGNLPSPTVGDPSELR